MIKAFYVPQGLVIGEIISTDNGKITVKNPAMVVSRQTDVLLMPLLHLVEENEVMIEMKDIAFGSLFTPKRELENHYQQIYGTGIIVSSMIPNA